MFKPRLSADNSIILSLSVAAVVIGLYNMALGPVADAHASPPNDGNMLASTKKAGVKATALVAGVFLLSQDPNVIIMGGAAIIAEELTYRHAIMANPNNGQVQVTAQDFMPKGGQPAAPATASSPAVGTVAGPVEAMAG